MSKAYSSDLRNRVIKCFIAKMKHADIAKKLDISLITIRKYSIKYKKEGKIEFKKEAKRGRKPKITDFQKLCDFVKEFVEKLTTLPVGDIFYLDESGFDIEMEKEHGWALKNARLLAERSGNRKGKRISVIAA